MCLTETLISPETVAEITVYPLELHIELLAPSRCASQATIYMFFLAPLIQEIGA